MSANLPLGWYRKHPSSSHSWARVFCGSLPACWISPSSVKHLPRLPSETGGNTSSPGGQILWPGYQIKHILWGILSLTLSKLVRYLLTCILHMLTSLPCHWYPARQQAPLTSKITVSCLLIFEILVQSILKPRGCFFMGWHGFWIKLTLSEANCIHAPVTLRSPSELLSV